MELELEGERSSLEKMLKELPEKAPRLALIQDIEAQFSGELKGFEDFRIIESSRDALINTLVFPGHLRVSGLSQGNAGQRGQEIWLSLHKLHELRTQIHHNKGPAL